MKTVLTVPEAAKARCVTRNTIHRWINQGLLKARKFGRDYVIKRADLNACRPNGRGRPRKKRRSHA